jgi:hypothetical protein
MRRNAWRPTVLGEFPAAAPGYPVLWLVKGNGKVPWGERHQLD